MTIDNGFNDNFIVQDGILKKYIGNEDIVSIPDGIVEIDAAAFAGNNTVTIIRIPDSVERIGRFSFGYCRSLSYVRIGFGVKSIPLGCFMDLSQLREVVLSDQIENIDDLAFKGCEALVKITFITRKKRAPITSEEKGLALEAMLLGKEFNVYYEEETENVPQINSIGNNAFAGCSSFDFTQIEKNTRNIGLNAFEKKNGVETTAPDTYMSVAACDTSNEEAQYDNALISDENESDIADNVNAVRNDLEKEIDFLEMEDNFEMSEQVSNEIEKVSADVVLDITGTDTIFEGVHVENGKIICETNENEVDDGPIAILNLSNRAYNCLFREKNNYSSSEHTEVMVSDIIHLSWDRLIQMRNMGVKTAEEIVEKTKAYVFCGIEIEQPVDNTIAPGYKVIDGKIIEVETELFVDNINLEYTSLSVRAKNSLKAGGVYSLLQLVELTSQQLFSFSSMGSKTVSEIQAFVPAYLESHKKQQVEDNHERNDISSASSLPELPELDPEVAVLAPEYAVVDGIIYNRKNHNVVQDVAVELLNLTVRSLNCMMRNGNKTISTLIGISYSDFRGIRNLGLLSANEIQEKLELYLEQHQIPRLPETVIETEKSTVSESEILACLQKDEFSFKSFEALKEMLSTANENDLRNALNLAVEAGKIILQNDLFGLPHPSFYEYISNLDESSGIDERAIRILKARANGSTLEEVGQIEGATRERVRQIEKKSLDKVTRRGHVKFDEDRYAYVFSTYSLEREFYLDYLGEPRNIWSYLTFRYSRGKNDYSEAVDDKQIALNVRRAIDKYIHRGYVMIDGQYILKQRGDIEDYVVEKYCKDEVTIDEFFDLYNQFLEDYGIDDEKLRLTEGVRVTRSNRLFESNNLLWKQNQRLRYYDISGTDYTDLLETINLGQYHNVELSTNKFIIDYPELMRRYDLRDEYEVHNLLKKIHAEKENPDLVFGRMPGLQFGIFDRDAAVKEILFAMAPVSQDDLAEMISLEYGTQIATIKANWLTCISEYYHQGNYSVDYQEMPEDHIEKLKNALTDDFYFFSELRKIYTRLVPNADYSLLSTFNLKKMGFLVGSSYVIQHFQTAEAYFDHLLATDDVVDIAPISKRYTGLTTYSAYLAGLKHEMKIIEFEPFQYINLRRLEKLGYDRSRLKSYGDRVWSFLIDDDFFTIKSLRRSGFEDDLEALGFGDLFYSSILKEDGRFSWQRIGNNVVLNPKGLQFTVHDFLVDRITKENSIGIDDFVKDLYGTYGISFDKSSVLEKIKGSDIYYDSIMEKLYADYSTYFEEI